MRLLEIGHNGELGFTKKFTSRSIPPYAILSHTWGPDDEEVVFKDVENGTGMNKAGYDKIRFCANQASCDGLKYFWVDSCCINKSDSVELSEAINSMFSWYSNATRCYVYLSDVSITSHEQNSVFPPQSRCEIDFRNSRWFARGWTLQELLAPASVEFFTREGWKLGDKEALAHAIHEITGIAVPALLGQPLSTFSVDERLEWAETRSTTREEDWAYSLLGIFGVFMPLIYGEGRKNATRRLKTEIEALLIREDASHRQRTPDITVANEAAEIRESIELPHSQPGAEAVESLSIVYYDRDDEPCDPHKFNCNAESEDELGRGAYGDVSKVTCTQCHQVYVRKIIRLPLDTSELRADRGKHMRDADLELDRYMALDHPHIVRYVHHEHGESIVQIYTEYCQYRDLEYFSAQKSTASTEEFAWKLLEALASALARCHHGLAAFHTDGILSEYTDFQDDWRPILHRNINPGNVLIAASNESGELVPKLGEFGTSFDLEDDGLFPSSQQAGTTIYWAPEIVEEARLFSGRIPDWSTKSDVWAAGAVVFRILTGRIPIQDPVKGLLANSDSVFQSLQCSDGSPTAMSALLGRAIIECLDSSPGGRPSALELLAVAIKADASERGFHRSASFWRAMSMHGSSEIICSATKRFVSVYLPILARSQTVFNPKEIAIIMSLAKVHCPEALPECHGDLCAGQVYKKNGWTVFHALACLGIEDVETIRLAIKDSGWTESEEFMHLALQKDNHGLLPSAVAASKQNLPLCVSLTRIEDRFRAAISDQVLQSKLDALHARQEKEIDFVFENLAAAGGQLSIPASHAATMMIESANRGCSYVVRKLVDIGIQPSIQDKPRQEKALHALVSRGNVSMISFLLDRGAKVNARDGEFRTPLHQAASRGRLGAARELLKRDADVNARDRGGRTPLYLAVLQGHADVVQLLLSAGADQLLRGGCKHRTPWQVAHKLKRMDMVKLLDA